MSRATEINYKSSKTCTLAQVATLPPGDYTKTPVQHKVFASGYEWTIDKIRLRADLKPPITTLQLSRTVVNNYGEELATYLWATLDELLKGATE